MRCQEHPLIHNRLWSRIGTAFVKSGYYQIKAPRYCPVIIFIDEASTLSHPHVLGVVYYGL